MTGRDAREDERARTGTLIVIAKEPRPGRVKTRLQSRFSPEQAAALARASLADTLDAARSAPAARRVIALEGAPGDWLPAGVDVMHQGEGTLDLRLGVAFDQAFAAGPGPVLLVGMDTPQLTAGQLTPDWRHTDALLGLSEDGGFWAIGLREPCPAAFPGIPMSTARTGAAQLARLHSLGLRVRLLPVLRDIDTPDDAAAVARLVPRSRFGRLHRELARQQLAHRRTSRAHPLDLYAAALRGEPIRVELSGGGALPIDVQRWLGAPDSADQLMLNRCEGTVLDLGCGPGRLVGALAAGGVPALGIDICERAVELTARSGASVLRRDLDGPLPAEGRWGTVLLADGNLGIGGDPDALLRRCRRLLRPAGLLLAEADPDDDVDDRDHVTLVDAGGRRAHPLPWARLGSAALTRSAQQAGFTVVEEWRVANRVFLAFRALRIRPGGPAVLT